MFYIDELGDRENVWLPFTLWSTALNALLCVWVVGLRALSAVYREVSPRDLGLVCTFSFLWGSGSACFSLGIQLVSENSIAFVPVRYLPFMACV